VSNTPYRFNNQGELSEQEIDNTPKREYSQPVTREIEEKVAQLIKEKKLKETLCSH